MIGRVESYRKREVRSGEPTWVYRNLMRSDGPWYSLMQRGVVVGHAREVALISCTFRVRQAGRRRVIATGVKNVHAFVVGVLYPWMPTWADFGEELTARYDPRTCYSFERAEPDTGAWLPLHGARATYLGPAGLRVWSPS